MSRNGEQINFLLNGLLTSTGTVLNAGTVTFQDTGGTAKDVYTDVACTTPAANPYTLNSIGTVGDTPLFARGSYKITVKTSGGVTVNTWNNLYFGDKFSTLWGGTAGGSIGTYTITPTPSITEYENGQRFQFIVDAAKGNTGNSTLGVSGLVAKTIMQQQGGSKAALSGGELPAGHRAEVFYDGTDMVLINSACQGRLAGVHSNSQTDATPLSIASVTPAQLAGTTLSITVNGSQYIVLLAHVTVSGNPADTYNGFIRWYQDSSVLGPGTYFTPCVGDTGPGGSDATLVSLYIGKPAAGTYTYSIYWWCSNASLTFYSYQRNVWGLVFDDYA